MRNDTLIKKRNIEISKRFNFLTEKYPHYKVSFVFEKVATEFYLSVRTVYGIISGEFDRNKKKATKKKATKTAQK